MSADEAKAYVGYGMLWTVSTATLAALFIYVSMMFSWHKETPHSQGVSAAMFNGAVELIVYRLDKVEIRLEQLADVE